MYAMKAGPPSNISFVTSNKSRARKRIRKHTVNRKTVYRCELFLLISLFGKHYLKEKRLAGCWWLTLVFLAAQEADIMRITI
jgi:hypothetical protein